MGLCDMIIWLWNGEGYMHAEESITVVILQQTVLMRGKRTMDRSHKAVKTKCINNTDLLLAAGICRCHIIPH